MEKLEPKKQFKDLYTASAKAAKLIDVPPMNYVMVDGQGDPNTSAAFQETVQALYGASYTVKFTLKKAKTGPEYTVAPLEGLWWSDDMSDYLTQNKAAWKWTLMIMQPSHVTAAMIAQAVRDLKEKRPSAAMDALRFERFHEGQCVQIMHVGPYSEEGPTIQVMHDFAASQGKGLRGRHHEIYMSDPRRVAPEKLKTILRQPVE